MANNVAASALAKAQAKIAAKYQDPEQRRKLPTVMGLALQNQDFSIPRAQELRTSPLRPVEINYFKDIAAGVGTTKAYNHSGSFGDTAVTSVTYVSHVETFGIPYKVGANNVFAYQEQLQNGVEMMWKNLRTRQDNSVLSFLYANRVQLTSATMNPRLQSAGLTGWNDSTLALEIPDSQRLLFMQKMKDAMYASNYRNELDVVADIQMTSNFMSYMNQGSGNQNNLSWQFLGVNVAESASVLDSNYTMGSVFVMPKGMLAGLNWNEQLNRSGLFGETMINNNIGMLGTMVDPFGSGAVADVSMYVQRADTSANSLSGSTQDFVLQIEYTLTIGYITAPLSLSLDSPIMEISQGS